MQRCLDERREEPADWVGVSDPLRVMLHGIPGAGKSSCLRWLRDFFESACDTSAQCPAEPLVLTPLLLRELKNVGEGVDAFSPENGRHLLHDCTPHAAAKRVLAQACCFHNWKLPQTLQTTHLCPRKGAGRRWAGFSRILPSALLPGTALLLP